MSRLCRIIGLVVKVGVFMAAATCLAVSTTWTNTTGDWFDGTKWDNGVPGNGFDAVINVGADILLTNSTAILGSLTMNGGTLTFSNWTTQITATNVVINSGTLTLPPAFSNIVGVMSNRIWIVCSNNFTLNTNAVINVNAKGWVDGPGAASTVSPSGGGGYGGKGQHIQNDPNYGGPTYGSTNAPVDPGSGGGLSSYSGTYGPSRGGGAVRIYANGTVTIRGTVNAEGDTHPNHYYNGSGSGGAIYITCGVFQGSTNGLLSVKGGGISTTKGGAGGGGRIAVNYTSVGPEHSVRFSAASGQSEYWNSNLNNDWWAKSEPGTLWLPDTALLSNALADSQLTDVRVFINTGSWSVNSLTVSNCSVTFAEGFQLNVTNTCLIDTNGVLGIGTLSGETNPAMTCGSLILTNGGTLTIYSGKTNGVAPDYGALVTVTGDVAICAGSWIIPFSHPTNGGSALFRMTNLTIAAGGGFNAHGRGYAVGKGPGQGIGTGGNEMPGGGGYGGKGGRGAGNKKFGGTPYGSTNAPAEPGSGGGNCIYAKGYGGGCIWVEVAANAIINGTMDADGGDPSHGYSGAGSGGGIYLTCATFGGTTNGILKADGGTPTGLVGGGGGGGGRIAVNYQNLASPHETRLSTAAGIGWTDLVFDNHWWNGMDRGTVWLSDTNLLSSTLADGLFNEARLVVTGFTTWTVTDLTVSNCSVFFEDPAFSLTVNGDLNIYNGKLGVHTLNCSGNITLTNSSGLAVTDLDCDGNLTLSGGSNSLWVYSGMTNGSPTNYGALVHVSGDLTTASDSWIYPYSHGANGGSPLFRIRNLFIATNSGFNANGRGFGVGKGPGAASASGDYSGGAGHGGKGGTAINSQPGGTNYGSSNAPLSPGSGVTNWAYGNAYGGGLVRIEAEQSVTVNGTIMARGGNPEHSYCGAGSGGGIFINCGSFAGDTNGLLSTIGGNTGAYGGGGGGGRIAVWYKVPESVRTKILADQVVRDVITATNYSGFGGTATVTNGAGWKNPPDPDGAYPGTCVFLTYEPSGTTISIQ